MKHPLRIKDFNLLLATRLFESLSVGFFEVPLIWWVLTTTGNESLVAVVAFVGTSAYLVASPFGGVLADRYSKKTLSISMLLVDASLTGVAAVLFLLGSLTLPVALVLLTITNVATALRGPALSALLPLILPKENYQKGNAAMGLSTSLANLSSFAVAGLANAAFGAGETLLICVSLLLAASIILVFLREPTRSAAKQVQEESVEEEVTESEGGFVEGFQVIWGNSLLLAIIGTAVVLNFLVAPLTVLAAPYAQLLGAGSAGYGYLSASFVGGQFLGFFLMNFFQVQQPLTVLVAGTLTGALCLVGVALSPLLLLSLVALAIFGVASALMTIQVQTILQESVSDELMGRVYGLFMALVRGAQPAGYALAGGALALFSVRTIFFGMGVLMAPLALTWLRSAVRDPLESPGTVEGGEA